MYRLWLHGLYGPRCLLSPAVKVNHSLTHSLPCCRCISIMPVPGSLPGPNPRVWRSSLRLRLKPWLQLSRPVVRVAVDQHPPQAAPHPQQADSQHQHRVSTGCWKQINHFWVSICHCWWNQNEGMLPGNHCCGYYLGTLSYGKVSATRNGDRAPKVKSMGARSSNEL